MPDHVTSPLSADASDEELFRWVQANLFVALLSDVLDEMNHRDQALPARIRPLDDTLVMVGRARTGLYRDVYEVPTNRNPYELEIRLIDDLKPGEIPVLACGHSGRIAPWGGLLTTASLARGAAGCLTDGYIRDTRTIRRLGFPVFHAGIAPLDSKGRGEVVEIDSPVACGGVMVRSGDLVVGDADGVIVVPRHAEREALDRAFGKLAGERSTEAALQRGETLASVFARIGVL
jgi:regulator of RNase E activity RraA